MTYRVVTKANVKAIFSRKRQPFKNLKQSIRSKSKEKKKKRKTHANVFK